MQETYRALTRSYRPRRFEEIVAQEHVSNTLLNAIKNNRLSHAYMFCGPRGVGKTTMARVLARAVNRVGDEIDGEALGNTLNIVEMDAASNRKIEDVRSLKEVIRVPPQNGRYKIFIIDEVHMLTKEAFNALLKTLEEPPSHAIFIFATTEPHKVLPTILSRVQRFDFKRVGVEEIVRHLKEIAGKEAIEIDEESLHVIARRADGALRDALGLMDQAIAFCGDRIGHAELLRALNVVGTDDLFAYTEAVVSRDAGRGLMLIRELIGNGVDIQEFLVSLTEHIRNLYVAQESQRLSLIEGTEEMRKRYLEHSSDFGDQDLMRMLHLVSETQHRLRDARQPRVQFELLFLKLVHMSRARDLNTLMSELRELKKKSGNGAGLLNGMGPESNGGTPSGSATKEEVTTSQSATAELPGSETERRDEEEKEEEEEEEIFGRPSIASAGDRQSVDKSEEQHEDAPAPGGSKRVDTLEDLISRWEPFLDEVKDAAPRTLYFQLQRVELSSLDGAELVVRADNEFARQLLEENQQLLFTLFKRSFGRGLRIRCKVERTRTSGETLTPYDRFRKLQQKDPHVRKLVELFGAEPDY